MEEKKKVRRMTIWLDPELAARMDTWISSEGYRNTSEFISQALRYYMGYLSGSDTTDYLAKALVDTIKGTIQDASSRECRLLYKAAVELNMMMNVIAKHFGGDEISLRELRRFAVEEVGRTNGQITFGDALSLQREILLEEGDD